MVIALMAEGDGLGGTERLIVQLALALRERGHGILVIGPAESTGKGFLGDEIRRLGIVYEKVPRRSMLDPRSVTDILRLLRRHRVDVMHSHEFAPSVFGTVACWLSSRTHVITMHSNLYFAGARRRRVAFRWAARNCRAVVAVSRDTAADAERLLGLENGSVHVIPNGIASRPGRGEKVRAELRMDDDEQLVLAIGNVSPRKAHAIILRALIQGQQRGAGGRWRLAVAGADAGSRTELLELAASNGVADRLHLLGPRSDTEDLLAAADVFAMSSLHEGMPLAIMEAMFAGKAIVSSVAGGIGEMIADGAEGLLVAVGDVDAMSAGLDRLLTDAGMRERLGAAARRRAQRQFGIEPMVDAYLRLYGE